jgi:hypothetical protein
MTIRYATIWNDQRPRSASPEEGRSVAQRAEVQLENTPARTKKTRAAKGAGRKICSGEQLAALLDTHRWTQRKPKR